MSLSIVTGKGGVGKTRLSLLLSQKKSGSLVVGNHAYLEEEASKLELSLPKIWEASLEDLSQEVLEGVLRIPALVRWASRNRLLKNLIRLAPNLDELLLIQKWIELSNKQSVIVDAPSTGNLLSILSAIETAKRLFDGGSLRKMADTVDEKLKEGKDIEFYLVALPEHSALDEMRKIESFIEQRYPKIRVQKVINRKHFAPTEAVDLREPLHSLAYERPQVESRRIEGLDISIILKEGAQSL